MAEHKDTLFYGDNLDIMRSLPTESIDLIYLDPPFNSQQNYNLLYKQTTGLPVPELVEAFNDTWKYDAHSKELAEQAIPKALISYGKGYSVQFWSGLMKALEELDKQMYAYLAYMMIRMLEIHRLLKPTGSLYLHCDDSSSHYLKIMLDNLFGRGCFRNQIVWQRTSAHNDAKKAYGRIYDVLLFYTKTDTYTFNPQYAKYSADYIKKTFRHKDERGEHTLSDITGPGLNPNDPEYKGYHPKNSGKGRHWAMPKRVVEKLAGAEHAKKLNTLEKLKLLDQKQYLVFSSNGKLSYKRYQADSPGMLPQSIWTDIKNLTSFHKKQNTGYATQKPLALLERIIKTSSQPGDLVFDPFCGCGTTIEACQRHNRRWLGCDIAILATRLVQQRLKHQYQLTDGTDYLVKGVPRTVEQAQALHKHDPFQFQFWAVEVVQGFPSKKKSDDGGIDGRLYFEDEHKKLQSMPLSIKGGKTTGGPKDIREMRGVLERESNAKLAGYISLANPTARMQEEAVAAGFYEQSGQQYPKIQLLTVQDILEGKRFETPAVLENKLKATLNLL